MVLVWTNREEAARALRDGLRRDGQVRRNVTPARVVGSYRGAREMGSRVQQYDCELNSNRLCDF